MLDPAQLNNILTQSTNAKFHKNSFNCSKCPKNGCPAWWSFNWTMTNTDTGETKEKIVQGCSFVIAPVIMTDMLAVTYKNMDTISSSTSKVDKALIEMKKVLVSIWSLVKSIAVPDKKLIESETKEI